MCPDVLLVPRLISSLFKSYLFLSFCSTLRFCRDMCNTEIINQYLPLFECLLGLRASLPSTLHFTQSWHCTCTRVKSAESYYLYLFFFGCVEENEGAGWKHPAACTVLNIPQLVCSLAKSHHDQFNFQSVCLWKTHCYSQMARVY